MEIQEKIRKTLAVAGLGSDPSGEGLVTSAVALMLCCVEGENCIWFIKRTEYEKDIFSGHVAFPGGKRKKEDSTLLHTVFREVEEELGFSLETEGRILGEMDFVRPFTSTVRQYAVKPFIAFIEADSNFIPNYEVAQYFRVPVKHLLTPKNRGTRERIRNDKIVNDYVFTYQEHIIWGLTGRILNEFFEKTSNFFPITSTYSA